MPPHPWTTQPCGEMSLLKNTMDRSAANFGGHKHKVWPLGQFYFFAHQNCKKKAKFWPKRILGFTFHLRHFSGGKFPLTLYPMPELSQYPLVWDF
jgi:hypothetical protein